MDVRDFVDVNAIEDFVFATHCVSSKQSLQH